MFFKQQALCSAFDRHSFIESSWQICEESKPFIPFLSRWENRLSQGWVTYTRTHREQVVEPESEHKCILPQLPQASLNIMLLPLEIKCITATKSHVTLVYHILQNLIWLVTSKFGNTMMLK